MVIAFMKMIRRHGSTKTCLLLQRKVRSQLRQLTRACHASSTVVKVKTIFSTILMLPAPLLKLAVKLILSMTSLKT